MIARDVELVSRHNQSCNMLSCDPLYTYSRLFRPNEPHGANGQFG